MARILVSYYKVQEVAIQTMMYYFEGFVQELRNCGNDVLIMNTAYFNPYESNTVSNARLDKLLLDEAIRFDPELIITFNHRIPKSILDNIDVPVVIWDGDGLAYFCDKEYIKGNISRYQLFSISEYWRKGYLDFGFSDRSVHFMPNATSIRPDDLYQPMNISFLGTRSWTHQFIPNQLKVHNFAAQSYATVKEYLLTNNCNVDYYIEKYFPVEKAKGYTPAMFYSLFEFRWLVLANVLDLGLTICGHHGRWEDVCSIMPQLLSAYSPRRVWTLEENNWFYNSSKISLCPMHPQAQGGAFAWRAFDVMASNSCLVVSESSDLRKLTKDYVELPFYSSPYDARRLCIELLQDIDKRNSIVQASQKYVEEHARWDKRFQEAASILDIQMYNPMRVGTAVDLLFTNLEIASLLKLNVSRNISLAQSDKHTKIVEEKKRVQVNFAERWLKRHSLQKIQRIIMASLCSIITGTIIILLDQTMGAQFLILDTTVSDVFDDISQEAGRFLCYAGLVGLALGYLMAILKCGLSFLMKMLTKIK